MAATTCWNCGARLTGPKCQWCGAAQTPEASQGSSPAGASAPQAPASYYGPGASAGQSADWQNQRTMVSQPQSWQVSPTVPGQPGGWQSQPLSGYPQPIPGQPGNWPAQQPTPGQMSGWPGAQPPGYPQPMPGQAYPGTRPATSAFPPKEGLDPASLLLGLIGGLVGGLVGGIIGAIIWAFFLEITRLNISYIAIGLGFLVGLGVSLGARKQQSMALAALGGVLGLLAFFLALYFRLSLLASDLLGEGTNLFALPFGDFFNALGPYLQNNLFDYVYFVVVPLVAAGSAYGGLRRTSRRR